MWSWTKSGTIPGLCDAGFSIITPHLDSATGIPSNMFLDTPTELKASGPSGSQHQQHLPQRGPSSNGDLPHLLAGKTKLVSRGE